MGKPVVFQGIFKSGCHMILRDYIFPGLRPPFSCKDQIAHNRLFTLKKKAVHPPSILQIPAPSQVASSSQANLRHMEVLLTAATSRS